MGSLLVITHHDQRFNDLRHLAYALESMLVQKKSGSSSWLPGWFRRLPRVSLPVR
jgi:hypothetical protein